MANIDEYLYKIAEAEKGEEVRGSIHDALQTLNRAVTIADGGAPIPVSSIEEMTDQNKLYLNVTNGQWYYFDGEEFVSGGVYGSLLTIEDDGEGHVSISIGGQ